jgi:hypothetical protein
MQARSRKRSLHDRFFFLDPTRVACQDAASSFQEEGGRMSVRTALLVISLAILVIITGYKFGKKFFIADDVAAPAAADESQRHGVPPADSMVVTPEPGIWPDRRIEPAPAFGSRQPLRIEPVEIDPNEVPTEPSLPFAPGRVVIVTKRIADVTVRNPKGVGRGDRHLPFGAVCDVIFRGTLTVVGIDEREALVRYQDSHQLIEAAGQPDHAILNDTYCPSGTLFYISRQTYNKRTEPSRLDATKALLRQER